MDDLMILTLALMVVFVGVCCATCLMMLVNKKWRQAIIDDWKGELK